MFFCTSETGKTNKIWNVIAKQINRQANKVKRTIVYRRFDYLQIKMTYNIVIIISQFNLNFFFYILLIKLFLHLNLKKKLIKIEALWQYKQAAVKQ